jgi:hypothetical protein
MSLSLDHIFAELRYYEDRARSDEETRDSKLATLIALSGAVLGLLAASLPEDVVASGAIVAFCVAVALFVCALLVATQFAIRHPLLAPYLGGPLELIPEVALEEFDAYLTQPFQDAERVALLRRALPVMNLAIAVRRRNTARKERCLNVATWFVAAGILATASYAAILAL